jgi:hypothetical protein
MCNDRNHHAVVTRQRRAPSCHPEPGRPPLANVGEGSAVAVLARIVAQELALLTAKARIV